MIFRIRAELAARALCACHDAAPFTNRTAGETQSDRALRPVLTLSGTPARLSRGLP